MPLKNFIPDDAGFLEIANSPEMHAALAQIGEKGKEIAIGIAQDFRVTGDYADSFEVLDTTIQWEGEYPGPRAAADLTNISDHAAAVEFGNDRDHKPHHVLLRTALELGGDEA